MNRKTYRSATGTIAVTLVAAAALAGCSRGGSNAAAGATGAKRDSSAVMIMSTLNNPFFVSVKNGAQAQAKKDGLSLDVQNANNSDATALNLAIWRRNR